MEVRKYVKKPVVIDAVQLTEENIEEVAEWCNALVLRGPNPHMIKIPTLEGDICGTLGDWVIKGIVGEFYPCKDDVFQMTYELKIPHGDLKIVVSPDGMATVRRTTELKQEGQGVKYTGYQYESPPRVTGSAHFCHLGTLETETKGRDE